MAPNPVLYPAPHRTHSKLDHDIVSQLSMTPRFLYVQSFIRHPEVLIMTSFTTTDQLQVIHPCAARLDVHKMQITASVLRSNPGT